MAETAAQSASQSAAQSLVHPPFWWDAAPREQAQFDEALPARCDVAIVGSGYTGLSAALQLARAGRQVLVIDAGVPGVGASTRNGGMIGSGHKLGYEELQARVGHDDAMAILHEGLNALAYTYGLIESEGFDCDLTRCGRFRAAWTGADYDAMARNADWMREHLSADVSVVERSDVQQEVASDVYQGGCIYHEHGSLHPGRFHQALLNAVISAGAMVIGNSRLHDWHAISSAGDDAPQLLLETSRGEVQARELLLATNGYTGSGVAGLRQHLVSVPSFLVATEPLSDNLAATLIPNRRMIVETRYRYSYFRMSPDGQRLIWGGRAALHDISPQRSAEMLRGVIQQVFPQLDELQFSHSWCGYTAMTMDGIPHVQALHPRVHAAGGYNGSGVAMAPYLGYIAAMKMLGRQEGNTVLSRLPFKAVPLYRGNPWFMRGMSAWYRFKDWRQQSA